MKLLKKEVFDINKVTVVGSPTITSDGVASGFSVNSYITALVDTSNVVDNVTIYSRFTYTKVGKTVWAGQGNNFTPRILISPTGNIMLYAYDGSQTGSATIVYDKINFAENEMIYAKCVISNAERIISVSSDGINWVEAKNTVALNLDLKTRLQKLYFGWISTAEYFIDGQIDLSSFKVFVDGKEVYTTLKPTYLIEKRKEGFDLSKFTVVGSPSITEYGVMSVIDNSNYLVTANTIDLSNADKWTIYTPVFRTPPLTGLNTIISNGTTSGQDGITLFIRANGYTSWCVQDTLGGNFIFKRDAKTTFIDGNLNQLKVEFNGSKYNLYQSINNGEFNLVDTFTSTTKTTINSLFYIGKGIGQYYTGDYLDVLPFSVEVNNKEVFTGTKEEYYMFK